MASNVIHLADRARRPVVWRRPPRGATRGFPIVLQADPAGVTILLGGRVSIWVSREQAAELAADLARVAKEPA